MAKSAEAIATVSDTQRPFDHGGRYVTILVPQNSKHENWVRKQLRDQFGEEHPPAINAIRVAEVSQDSVLYLAHPLRIRKKVKDRTGKEVWKRVLELFVSRPVDVGAECMDTPRRGARILDHNKLIHVLATSSKNDPAGWFFLPYLSGFHKADFTEATIQLMSR